MTRTPRLFLPSLMALLNLTALSADWESLPPLPEPNGGCMAGCVNNRLIIAGGTNWKDGTKRWLDKVHVFDPATKQWSAGPSLPHPLAYAAFASDGTSLFIAGGADGTRGRNEVYALRANLDLKKLGELPQPSVFAACSIHRNGLRILGGTPDPDDWSKAVSDFLTFDFGTRGTTSTAPLTALHHGLGLPAVAAAGNRLFSFTGAWLNPATQQVGNLAESFAHDFATNSWRAIAPFPKAVRGLSAVALDEKHIYLAGGHGTDEEGFLSEAFLYEVDADRYTPAKPLPLTALTCLVKCGDFLYVLGGEDAKKHRTAQCWRLRVDELLKK